MTMDVRAVAGARILVVEDENIIARDIQSTLQELGYLVCGVASSGEDAVRRAEELRPDLVLMDIKLRGGIDGVEAGRRIRERLDVPVVFLTAYADPGTIERATSSEPYGYVLKPFDDRELHVAVLMGMVRHQAFRELDKRVRERTDELMRSEAKYRQLSAVAELGLFALRTRDLGAVMRRAVDTATGTLGMDLGYLLEATEDGAVVLRAGVGWDAKLLGEPIATADRHSHAGYVLASAEPVVVEDLGTETRFDAPVLRRLGAVSGVGVVIYAGDPDTRPYGVLGTHARQRRSFSSGDVAFLQAVSNVVAIALERARTEEAVRVRDEFLSVASHELRTPLAALQLQLDGLFKALRPQLLSEVGEKVTRAIRHTGRLGRLVERLLDVSRLETGRMVLELEDVDLTRLVQETADAFRDEAERAGCELRLTLDAGVIVRGDRTRIEQVVTNLLANAIKYGARAPVEVRLQPSAGVARLSVSDRGIGISPEDQGRIFARFERAVSVRHYGGLGLGLYITRRVIEAHGGKIQVDSAPGRGSTFWVELPLTTNARPRVQA